MVFTKVVPALVAAALVVADVSAMPRVDAGVHRTLRQEGSVNLIVTMKKGTSDVINSVQEAVFVSRAAKIDNLVARLELNARESMKEVTALLSQESTGATFTSSTPYWVTNQYHIEGANLALVESLAKLPSILEVREELRLPLPTIQVAANTSATIQANEWGVTKIKAADVWATGNRGEGIVVSAIDTGVRGTHEALKGSFRGGQFSWFDPEAKKAAPYDNNGHGSHTMGTIAGTNGVGVAPGAKWIACKGCRTSDCPESDLLACAQFITCPTDPTGTTKDCSQAPRVVSNSWGGGQGDTFYKAAVDAWQAAGIIPIFANGNSGPNCGTANSPGDYANVIAVGATDSSDGLASFSSKGPATSGLLKPEISAPGANVRSAWYSSDTSYNSISGTSMATPHVTGAVALLLAAKPTLNYEGVKAALLNGVDTATLKSAGKTCGGTPDGKFPNNNYGYGRLNILNSIGGATPAPSTPAPVTPGPVTPAPVTPGPSTPAPVTPAPTTKAPVKCSGLGQAACKATPGCTWHWFWGCY